MPQTHDPKDPRLFPIPPSGVDFSDAAQVAQLIERVNTASFELRSQPPVADREAPQESGQAETASGERK